MIGYILLTILVILIALLFIPCDFYGQGRITEDIHLEWGLAWAGGLVSVRWKLPAVQQSGAMVRVGPWVNTQAKSQPPIQNSSQPESAADDERKSPKKPRQRQKPNWSVFRYVLDKQVGQEVMSLVGNLWRSLRLRCELAGDYGTYDPALTAYIAALIALFNNNRQKLDLNPQFTHEEIDLNGVVQGQLRPGLILWDASRFMLKRPIRKIWWTMLREGKKNDRRNKNV